MALTQVSTGGVKDGSLLNADINASAAIARTKLANVDLVDDTSPQLGGDLQSNGNDIDFADNDKAIFGTSGNLEIYSTGSESLIHENATGNLKIKGTNLRLADSSNNLYMFMTSGAGIEMYHSGSKKCETTSTGINISGSVPTITLSDTDGSTPYSLITAGGGDLVFDADQGNEEANTLMLFRVDDSERMRIDSSGRVLIGTTTGAAFSNRQLSVASSSGTTSLELRSATDGDGRIIFTDSTSSSDTGAYKGQIMYDQTNDFMSFNTNGNNERFRINQSGGVGIGLTDIAGFGGSYKGIDVGSKGSGLAGRTDNVTIDLRSNTFYDGSNHKYGGTSTTAGQLSVGGAQLTFSNAPTGTAGATATLTQRLNIGNNGAIYASSGDTSNASQTLKKTVTNADSIDYLQCRSSNNSLMAKIGGNGGISNFQSNDANLSDETMKKNIVDCESIIEKFKQWKLRKFNYNSEADGTPLTYGVIAQEVESIHSDLVNADFPVDESGKEVMKKTVKDHQLMMLGFKALQEAIAKIEVLETKVAALEAA